MSVDGEYEPSAQAWVRDQVELYEKSGGTQGTTLRDTGLPVVIITNRGARSGKVRKTPVMRVEHDGRYAACAQCHRGIFELFTASVHSPEVTHTGKELPVCADCHSAHSIQRTDLSDFRLHIMEQCGRCHRQITDSYFETFHGKVSKLGYLKTAKCYDCHGAHDILPVNDP